MAELQNRIAVVTGAGGGIGRGIAAAFAVEGAGLALVDLDAPSLAATQEHCGRVGARCSSVVADVTDPDAVSTVVDQALREFGRVDVLVNSAGVASDVSAVEMSYDEWRRVIDVDLNSVFLCTKAVLPTMIAQRFGRIINIGSQLALKGGPLLTHYCAAKSGVHGFTRALAYEVAEYNITVNVIAPGPIETQMLHALPEEWRAKKQAELPLGRFGRVEEIAPTAVLLASGGGSYYTGSTLNISGGDVM